MRSTGIAVALAAVAAAGAAWAPLARAASPVSPSAGAVTGDTPTFVASLAAGDIPLAIQVASTPETISAGLVARVGSCLPARTGPDAACTIGPLASGTYWWTLVYQRNDNCTTISGRRYCLPTTHFTRPLRFVVRAATPAPTPTPTPTPAPTPGPPPPPAPGAQPPASGQVVARPPDGGAMGYTAPEQTYAGTSVVVHYVTTGLDAPPLNDDNHDGVPDYVEQVAQAGDTALGFYAAAGFQTVRADTAGPDSRLDIYVKHFTDPDLYGLTLAPTHASGGTFVVVSPHLDESPKLARGSLAGTVAHELFHVVQFSYLPDGSLPRWVTEGSAVAMSLLVYPSIDDLTDADYFDQWLAQSWRPLYDEQSYCDHCYGGGLWWDFLMHADRALLPDYLRRLAGQHAAGDAFGLGVHVLDETMRARGDGTLASVFAGFSTDLYRFGLHPRPTYSLRANAPSGHVVWLNGLAAHYVPVTVPARAHRVTVQLQAGSGVRPRVALLLGGPRGRLLHAGADGVGAVFRSVAERRRILVVVSSASPDPVRYRLRVRSA